MSCYKLLSLSNNCYIQQNTNNGTQEKKEHGKLLSNTCDFTCSHELAQEKWEHYIYGILFYCIIVHHVIQSLYITLFIQLIKMPFGGKEKAVIPVVTVLLCLLTFQSYLIQNMYTAENNTETWPTFHNGKQRLQPF